MQVNMANLEDTQRITGVVSGHVWDALDRLNVSAQTNNSRTVLILLEYFLEGHGLMKKDQMRSDPSDYQMLCDGAKKAKKLT
jgi:hypothetical protein